MICQKCHNNFPENQIQESHDIPVELFEGNDRKERKNLADKHGRHNLCIGCHIEFERRQWGDIVAPFNREIKDIMITRAKKFSKRWFDGSSV